MLRTTHHVLKASITDILLHPMIGYEQFIFDLKDFLIIDVWILGKKQ